MPIADTFEGHIIGLASPYTRAVAVTPHNDNDLSFRTRAIVVTAAGIVNVHMAGTTTPVAIHVAAGIAMPIRVDRVLVTSTTATGIVALG